jgi:hypothetical protein
MDELYQELLQRLAFLESRVKSNSDKGKISNSDDGRILELQLVLVRVQQLILADINLSEAELHNRKMFKKFGLP